MALLQSSITNPMAANYMGRLETQAGVAPTGTIAQSSFNNPYAANFGGYQETRPGLTQSGQVLGATTPTAPAPTNNTGGGGSGPNLKDPNAKPGDGYFWDAADGWKSISPQAISEQELSDVYNPAFDYLNQAESTLRGQLPQFQQEAEAQFGANKSLLSNQRQSALDQLRGQREGAQRRTEDVVSASRRMFQELQQANQQRFGGASSAGAAASEIQGREFQSNRNAVARDLNSTLREIEMNQANVENEFQTGLQQLEAQKQQQIGEAQRSFQDKLLEISRQRGELASAKASARLQELQNLRDRIFQINLQQFQFQQQLTAQREAAKLQLEMNRQQLTQSVGAGQQAVNSFSPEQLNASTIGGARQAMANPYVGQMRRDDELMNSVGYIAGSSATDPRFANLLGR